MKPQFGELLKYANLQVAAEAFYRILPRTQPEPGLTYAGNMDIEVLKFGNDHASRFPDALASEFVTQWEVAQHKSNTTTGFSGTLFRGKAGGPYTDELVLSFRSTEFVDDQVRPCGLASGVSTTTWQWLDIRQ